MSITATYTGPTTSLAIGNLLAQYAFVAADLNDGELVFPAIQMSLIDDGAGGLATMEEHGFATHTGGLIGMVANAGGSFTTAGSASYLSGGTLKITKDEGATNWSWQGPGHTTSRTWFGSVIGGELAPSEFGLGGGAAFTSVFVATDAQIQGTAFFGKQNGTPIKGAQLNNTDRGSWLPTIDALTPWDFLRSGNVTVTDTPDATSEGAKVHSDVPPPGAGSAIGTRVWDQSVYLPGHDPNQANADMTTAREHGPLFVALIYPAAADTVKGRDSYDNGGTWQEGTIYTSGGTTNRSPNILWAVGRLYAVWNRGPEVVQAFSTDLGSSWSTPVSLLTGTNPRTVYDPRHGVTFYFYVVGGDLLLRRSSNFGVDFIDASPLLVASGVGSQAVAAEIGSDSTVVVGFILTGAWTQVRSKDYGVSWV